MKIFASLKQPEKDSHKGQNGKLLVIGGSTNYSGAPMFELLAARRFVDLLYFYPAENDPFLIQAVKSIPEAIVVYDINRISQVDCALFGGGMDEDLFDISFVSKCKKIVLDAGGFAYFSPDEINSKFILTPHALEFERFFEIPATEKNVIEAAKKHNCVILRKGTPDVITDGKRTMKNNTHNQGMTKGGTGDTLAGLTAALACTNPNFESAAAATYINGLAGNMLMKKFGYNFCASDVAEKLPEAYLEAIKRKPF